MSESDQIILQSWIKLFQEILLKFKTVYGEKNIANYPISQETENLMYLAFRSTEFTLNSMENDLDGYTISTLPDSLGR
jgi:hypothetical protein